MTGKRIGECKHIENYRATIVTDRQEPLENPLILLIVVTLRIAYLRHLLENPQCVEESGTDRELLQSEYSRLSGLGLLKVGRK
jgi:hypothetical protein